MSVLLCLVEPVEIRVIGHDVKQKYGCLELFFLYLVFIKKTRRDHAEYYVQML